MSQRRVWTIELEVREDAPSVFVPAELLPGATNGDGVSITSTNSTSVRRGRIVEQLDDPERGQFFSVSLD